MACTCLTSPKGQAGSELSSLDSAYSLLWSLARWRFICVGVAERDKRRSPPRLPRHRDEIGEPRESVDLRQARKIKLG